jgi:hypothetical protein
MSDDLLKRLSRIGERVSIPCPDNIRGCLVFHYRVDTDPACVEAIDEIERLRAENERMREALEGVLSLAESYLNIMPDRHGVHIPKLDAARAALGEEKK